MSLVPSATEIGGCSESTLSVSLRLSIPAGVQVGGYQAFLRFPARYFEPVRFEALSGGGFVQVGGPAPIGEGYLPCTSEVADPWADLAGEDVVSVIATVYGTGSTDPLVGSDVELGRFVFRPREATPQEGAVFSSNVEPCRAGIDSETRVFDPAGASLPLQGPESFSVRVTEGAGPEVTSFSCQKVGAAVRLSWVPPAEADYMGYRIYRNGVSIATFVIKSPVAYEDKTPPAGDLRYEIVLLMPGGAEGCPRGCEVSAEARFIRGDANEDNEVNISDPIAVLGHLFLGEPITCLDAGDFDDSGVVNLTDAVAILDFLFKAGVKPTPPPPFPAPGVDPTPDGIGC